jgi:serine/threonine-protein kinase
MVLRKPAWAVLLLSCLHQADALAGPAPVGRITTSRQANRVGSGGFGNVYWGRDELHRRFAMKLNDHDNQTYHEAEILKDLNGYEGWPTYHRIAPVGGAFHNRPVIITDWVRGVSLHDYKTRDQSQVVRIALVTLRHLTELHRRGYVHGDIKPRNIMIDPERGSPSVKLIDFGIAVRLGSRVERGNGTPDYRAPEQNRDSVWTAATDVWGIAGVILNEITGHPPNDVPQAAWGLVEGRGLRSVLKKALADDPRKRYQSAAAFAAALKPYERPWW